MKEVRTRFAPSPTGFQHLGGFRTAFFAWLFAKHHGGKFVLRIEDTDCERTVPGAVRFILEELAWFGIFPDEGPSLSELKAIGEYWDGAPDFHGPYGPYVQSQRLARYKEVAEELIAKGFAYRCDCTPEMLERERNEQMARRELPGYSGYCRDRKVSADVPHVVRFKMPQHRSISLTDAVRGNVTWNSLSLKDTVILKSDGFPMYHLAVVVDDHDMKISHILRGIEWLPSAPIHVLLYEALGWEPPVFAHFPVINGPDGKKLSKRSGAATSRDAREKGFLPEAVLNFVSLIGWAPGEGCEQEIFSREELVSRFSLEGINQASGIFDMTKMEWMNGLYIRKLPVDDFIKRATPFLEAAGIHIPHDKFAQLAPHVQERTKLLTEIAPMVDFLSDKPLHRDMAAMFQKGMDPGKAREVLQRSHSALSNLPDFSVTAISDALRAVATELGLKPGSAFVVLRVAVTGKTITPPLFESFAVLGKEKVLVRISEALDALGSNNTATQH
ncbi:MAG: glutamate--tRNA ligase [Oligoflexia bacterium]|nr:glutamate--tRNA ligase [Oligoflexia bacterium]